MLSTTSVKGKSFPIEMMKLPMNKINGDAQFGSFFDINDIVFFNFHPQCEINSYAIHSNIKSIDSFSIHNFDKVKLKNIFKDNLLKIEESVDKAEQKICGNFPCTGLKNIIVKFKDLIETKNEQINNPQIETIGTNLLQYKALSNENTNSITDINLLKSHVSFISKTDIFNFIKNGICKEYLNSNSYYCSSHLQPAHLIFENFEPEARTKALHPVYVISDQFEYKNKLNSFGDHECSFGYDSLLRTPRFPSTILMRKDIINNYDITFTSTNPNRIKMQLIDADWNDKILNISDIGNNHQINRYVVNIKIRYQSPLTVIVSKDNLEIKADIYTDMANNNYLNMNFTNQNLCGKNVWNTDENLLDLFITNEQDCILFIDVVNSIKLSIRYDVNENDFYNNNSHYSLMTKIAKVLGIDISQVKIASIIKGSTIVNFDILEKTPAEIIEKDINNNKNNINNSNSTSNQINTNSGLDTNTTMSRSLVELADNLINIIGNGQLSLEYQILSSNVKINTARNNNTIIYSNDSNNHNEQNKNNTISNSTNDNDKKDKLKVNNYFWYYLFCSVIIVIIIILLVLIICLHKARGDNKLIHNESNTDIYNVTGRSNFEIELKKWIKHPFNK